jgi:hypothetical protein
MGIEYQIFDTNRVESDFRPLLDIIDVPTLGERLRADMPLSYKNIGKYISFIADIPSRLAICIKDNLNDCLGYSSFGYLDNSYLFIICLSQKLFDGEKFSSQKYRRIIVTHEYTHFISSVFCVPSLNTPEQIEALKKEYATKMTLEILTEQAIQQIEKQHAGRTMDNYPKPHIFFDDKHYRLEPDKTKTNYHNLYNRFLLSRDSFEAFFKKSEIKNIKRLMKTNKIPDAHKLAFAKVTQIAQAMDFEDTFIIYRTREILISYVI